MRMAIYHFWMKLSQGKVIGAWETVFTGKNWELLLKHWNSLSPYLEIRRLNAQANWAFQIQITQIKKKTSPHYNLTVEWLRGIHDQTILK